MSKFKKKPIVVDAISVSEALHTSFQNWLALPVWLSEAHGNGDVLFFPDYIDIKTLEGSMRGGRGDWIIRGVAGELYPCKPDVFAKTYDAVDATEPTAAVDCVVVEFTRAEHKCVISAVAVYAAQRMANDKPTSIIDVALNKLATAKVMKNTVDEIERERDEARSGRDADLAEWRADARSQREARERAEADAAVMRAALVAVLAWPHSDDPQGDCERATAQAEAALATDAGRDEVTALRAKMERMTHAMGSISRASGVLPHDTSSANLLPILKEINTKAHAAFVDEPNNKLATAKVG